MTASSSATTTASDFYSPNHFYRGFNGSLFGFDEGQTGKSSWLASSQEQQPQSQLPLSKCLSSAVKVDLDHIKYLLKIGVDQQHSRHLLIQYQPSEDLAVQRILDSLKVRRR